MTGWTHGVGFDNESFYFLEYGVDVKVLTSRMTV